MAAVDPREWAEFQSGTKVSIPAGMCEVLTSEPAPVWLEMRSMPDVAVPVSYGTSHRFEAPRGAFLFVNDGVRAFVRVRESTSYTVEDEPAFTNADRLPLYSEGYLEIIRATREFEFERRQALAEIRRERAALAAARQQESPGQNPQRVEDTQPDGENDQDETPDPEPGV